MRSSGVPVTTRAAPSALPPTITAVTEVFFKTRAHSDSGLIGTPLMTAFIAALSSVLVLVVSNLTYI